jgi:beta propeller repeat protein
MNIYGYEIGIQSEFAICTDSAEQMFPIISGDTIIWMDKRNGNWDIYGTRLLQEE